MNLPPSPSAPTPSGPTNHLRCIGYALRTLLRVLPALGRDRDHVNAPPGLAIKHFVIAGVIGTLLLVGTLIAVVRLLLALVL
ncbi:MAG: DUF2970 domain-containing protein [Burkholderiales bacterium]|nr:DUF2970 domain-containing protein [Burkholderiales bacterium]